MTADSVKFNKSHINSDGETKDLRYSLISHMQIYLSGLWSCPVKKLQLSSLLNSVILHIFETEPLAVYLLHVSLSIVENIAATLWLSRHLLLDVLKELKKVWWFRSTCYQLPIWSLLGLASSLSWTIGFKTLPQFAALASTSRERVVHTKLCIHLKRQLENVK